MINKNNPAQPKVSVVISSYNYGRFIQAAINSVYKQDYKNFSLFIINDGSTDNTDLIVKKLQKKHPDIKYIKQHNQGIVSVRNKALKIATGKYLVQLDADDTLQKNYITEVVKVAEKENADIVYTNYKNFESENTKSNFPDFNIEVLKNRNFIHVSSLVRISAVKGIYFDENLNGLTHEDWDFFLSLCLNGKKAVLCKSTLLNYRIHENTRNNRSLKPKTNRKFVDVYGYIIDKHSKKFPESFGYLVGRVISHWYADLDDRNKIQIRSRNRALIELSDAIEIIENTKKSKSFKLGNTILHPAGIPKQIIKILAKKKKSFSENEVNRKDLKRVKEVYDNINLKLQKKKLPNNKKAAVILHLFYLDLWDYFNSKLSRLNGVPFDLYVSIPIQTDRRIKEKILLSYPEAIIIEVPNRGRDVLPFIKFLEYIDLDNYRFVLKLHSKKSKHREDGKPWLDEITDCLLPSNKLAFDVLMNILNNNQTGMVGPENNYLSLAVNYQVNQRHTMGILDDVFDSEKANRVDRQRFDFGFFAGTMFWVNTEVLKAIKSERYQPINFELEKGQIDGTFAHALERVFCLISQLKNNKVYSTGSCGTLEIEYDEGVVPEWSDLYKIMKDL